MLTPKNAGQQNKIDDRKLTVYYAVGLSRADSAAHFYGELRNVAEQVVLKLKRQAKERGRSSLRSMCGKLRSVAALVVRPEVVWSVKVV